MLVLIFRRRRAWVWRSFWPQLADYAKSYFGSELSLLTRERHRKALNLSLNLPSTVFWPKARPGAKISLPRSFDWPRRALGRLTGRVDVEDILDVIFRDFCIGK